MTQGQSAPQEDIIVTGVPLPRLHASPECLEVLKGYETGGLWDGKRVKLLPHGTPALAAYPDNPDLSKAAWTIGWGATGKDIHKGVRWTIQECELRFLSDVTAREASLRVSLRGAATTQCQFEAILLLVYNAGIPPTLLAKHRAGDYKGAAAEFLRWDHVEGKVVDGLTSRRRYESDHYLGKN